MYLQLGIGALLSPHSRESNNLKHNINYIQAINLTLSVLLKLLLYQHNYFDVYLYGPIKNNTT